MSAAREEVLGRIRSALGERPPATAVARDYRRAGDRDILEGPELIDLFAEQVADYRAVVHRVGESGVAAAVRSALDEHAISAVAVPAGLPEDWVPAGARVDDGSLTTADLDAVDGVLTTCAVGVAQTGTIVLDGGPGQGRRALTLVPDFHLCIVPADRVVAAVPEAVAALDPTRPLTWISGPSATSDIELNRVEGVHGPRTLVVLVVSPDGEQSPPVPDAFPPTPDDLELNGSDTGAS